MTRSNASTGPPGVGSTLVAGVRLVHGGKRYLLLAYACNLLLAMPLALVLMSAIRSSLGSSLAGERMVAGFDSLWFNSFSAQATGVATTLRPSVVGIGAVFDALDAFLAGFDRLTATGLATGVLPVALLYLVLWTFLTGGFLARYAAAGEPSSFLRDAARWFPRLLGVALLAGALYVLLLGYLRPLLDLGIYVATRDTIDERVHFAWTLGAYLLLWTLVWTVNLVVDYAKVALVRDGGGERVAALGVGRALVRGARFVAGNPLKTAGLYAATGAVGVALLLLYWAVAPGAGTSSPAAILVGFALGQLFVLSRAWTRCLFYATEMSMYSGARVREAAAPLAAGQP